MALALCAGLLQLLPGTAHSEHREILAELKGETPRWYQPPLKGGYPTGCGPTAWAIVYGYWTLNHPGVDLFPGHVVNATRGGTIDAPVVAAMERLGYHLEIVYRETSAPVADPENPANDIFRTGDRVKVGGAMNSKMCNGIEYAKENGYSHSRCFKLYGSEFDKFEHIKRHLEANKPVILNMSTKGHNATNHYVVAEKARKRQEKVGGNWRDRDVEYYVNYGWGGKVEWISARQVGRNTSQVSTVTAAYLIDVSNTPLPMATEINEEACRSWCEGDDGRSQGCVTCSRTIGCGPGYRRLKNFTEAGKNFYACAKRDTERADASEENRKACEEWCQSNPECKTCSTQAGCGAGYHSIKSWRGRGNNYHACAERPPSGFDQASDANHTACQTWCDSHEGCIKCSTLAACGAGFTTLKSWTGRGKNWHACGHSERQQASDEHKQACEDWCRANSTECAMCTTKLACGTGYDRVKAWTGKGRNWYACKKRATRDEASQGHQAACEAWCGDHSECARCSTKPGCGMGYKQIKGWTGRGKNWFACKKR